MTIIQYNQVISYFMPKILQYKCRMHCHICHYSADGTLHEHSHNRTFLDSTRCLRKGESSVLDLAECMKFGDRRVLWPLNDGFTCTNSQVRKPSTFRC